MMDERQEKPLILFRYRGRTLDELSLTFVRSQIEQHGEKGRSHIARMLCEHWGWRQANGALKEFACRDFLLRLEEAGLVVLPARKCTKNNLKPKDFSRIPFFVQQSLAGGVSHFSGLEVRPVADREERYLCDWLIHHHHYLGYDAPVGEHLKYLAFLSGQVVACIIWASAAWRCGSRETFIGWNDSQKRAHLPLVANNVRFLILPWIQIKHLASKILAANTRRLSGDWQEKWNHQVVLAETFVDIERFAGTCYRAANWIFAGVTKGSAKRGASYYHHGHPKALYLYPLHPRFRERLCL